MKRTAGLVALVAVASASLAAPLAAQPDQRGWGGNGGGWNDGGSGSIRCESWNYRYARCNANTSNGVRIGRVLGGNCGSRNWGSGRNYIWVNNGCRAEFDVGRRGGDGGPSTGAVIAGAAVAAGLLALLLSKGKKKEAESSTDGTGKPPAVIDIGPNQVQPAAEAAFRQCINEAARQIGATGGTRLRLTGTVETREDGRNWRFRLPLQGLWPGDTHATPAECLASASKVELLDFLPG